MPAPMLAVPTGSTPRPRWIALNDDIGGLNNEFQHLGVLTIGLDPNDANRVYIATGQYAGTESWKLNSRIYRSTNRGATWTYTTPGFKMGGNGEGRGTGERMAVDPVNGATSSSARTISASGAAPIPARPGPAYLTFQPRSPT